MRLEAPTVDLWAKYPGVGSCMTKMLAGSPPAVITASSEAGGGVGACCWATRLVGGASPSDSLADTQTSWRGREAFGIALGAAVSPLPCEPRASSLRRSTSRCASGSWGRVSKRGLFGVECGSWPSTGREAFGAMAALV